MASKRRPTRDIALGESLTRSVSSLQVYAWSPLILGALKRTNFLGMLVDTLWALISVAVVVSMRGRAAPAVAIAVYNQLEELNTHIRSVTYYKFLLKKDCSQTVVVVKSLLHLPRLTQVSIGTITTIDREMFVSPQQPDHTQRQPRPEDSRLQQNRGVPGSD